MRIRSLNSNTIAMKFFPYSIWQEMLEVWQWRGDGIFWTLPGCWCQWSWYNHLEISLTLFNIWPLNRSTQKCNPRCSVQFSHSVVSNSLRPHELQHARPLCPSPTPGAHSDSRPSSQWCHPAISSLVVPFSSRRQSLPGSESFPGIQLFPWGDQSTGVSALASFLPRKSQGWSPSEWTGWISLQSKGFSRVF